MNEQVKITAERHDGVIVTWSFEPTETETVIAARRLASAALSVIPHRTWSAMWRGNDVTEELSHVVRATVGGDDGPEAEFFLQVLP